MKKNKCSICLKRKGKRLCKIKANSMICSRCCAEIRNPACAGCSYYIDAEKFGFEKTKRAGFDGAIASKDSEIDNAVDNALIYVENGNIEKGEELLLDLIRKYPDSYMVQYGMGTVQALKGNYSDSITYFDNCLEISPYYVQAWFNKAVSLKNFLDVGGAIEAFQKVVEYGDEGGRFVIDARSFLSEIEARIQSESGLNLEAFLHSMDDFNTAFSNLQNQEYEKAIAGFQKVLAQNENHVQSYGNLGICYAVLEKKQEALRAFDKALSIDPEYKPALDNKMILLSLGEGKKMTDYPIEAVDYYKTVIEAQKEN